MTGYHGCTPEQAVKYMRALGLSGGHPGKYEVAVVYLDMQSALWLIERAAQNLADRDIPCGQSVLEALKANGHDGA
jgi:hypothetical protein